jgi:hypothetical protein
MCMTLDFASFRLKWLFVIVLHTDKEDKLNGKCVCERQAVQNSYITYYLDQQMHDILTISL